MHGRPAETIRLYHPEVVVMSLCQVACLQSQLAPHRGAARQGRK